MPYSIVLMTPATEARPASHAPPPLPPSPSPLPQSTGYASCGRASLCCLRVSLRMSTLLGIVSARPPHPLALSVSGSEPVLAECVQACPPVDVSEGTKRPARRAARISETNAHSDNTRLGKRFFGGPSSLV